MAMRSIKKPGRSTNTNPSRSRRGGRNDKKPRASNAPSASAGQARTARDPNPVARITKQERVLTLLARPEGAGVDEIMRATGWQVHSVRGFLAGTVKKKLGFSLTSSAADGEARRYRIGARQER
jgi:hypothetical protein